jgi:hypothetical protein
MATMGRTPKIKAIPYVPSFTFGPRGGPRIASGFRNANATELIQQNDGKPSVSKMMESV